MATIPQFTTIRTEGGVLPVSLLERVARGDTTLVGLNTDSYHLARGERFGEVINRSWLRLVGAWAGLRDALNDLRPSDPATGPTRERWLLILFQELGYGRLQTAKAVEVDGAAYPVSHEWGSVPIHLVGAGVKLDTRTAGVAGAARSSPHSLVQDLLNRSPERLWGFVSNGLQLRLLRDNVALTRQAYVEFDLEAMMDGEVFADFTLIWLLAHQSRVEADQPDGCWLERWSGEARVQGSRALEHLSEGVETAIESLGSGFLAHADNREVRAALESGSLSPKDLYRQLLRVVYRLLFVLVAEERNLLFLGTATPEQRGAYQRYYSVGRVRQLAEKRRGTRHTDLWEQIKVVVARLGSDTGCVDLGLPALGSFLFSAGATSALDNCRLANDDLLAAMRALSGRNDDRAGYRWRFDYRNLGAEELGSVYETLLDLAPEIDIAAGTFTLKSGDSERRSTGSHYTPTPILKRVLDFALEPTVLAAMAAEDPEAALLDLRVLDCAAGSGHFLIAAAHRIAQALASVRTGETSPTPEAVREALRDVVARCLYGVDLSPMAVELCKVALWLETLDPGKPLSFLDHHIRVGNSLLGVPVGATVNRNRAAIEAERTRLEARVAEVAEASRSLAADDPDSARLSTELRDLRKQLAACVYESWTDAIPDVAFKPVAGDDREVARKLVAANKRQRRSGQLVLAAAIDELPADLIKQFDRLGAGAEKSVEEANDRASEFEDIQQRAELRQLLLLADTWTSAFFWPLSPGAPTPPTQELFASLWSNPAVLPDDTAELVPGLAEDKRFFHFELAWPEVFKDRGGFDVVLGNPPYLGGMKISTTLGDKVHGFLKATTSDVRTGGRVDLAAYFVRRGFDLLRPDGDLCFITTNTIAQGDTREAGLQQITHGWGGAIQNAERSLPWEGDATVNVAVIHLRRGASKRNPLLDGVEVDRIGSDLSTGTAAEPTELTANRDLAAAGTNIIGSGFVIDADARRRLLEDDRRNYEVIKPFIGGRHAMQSPDPGTASRWVIDFGYLSLEDAETYRAPMEVVRRHVKPQRDEAKEPRVRTNWWRFGRPSAALYERIAARSLGRVIAIPEVSKVMVPVFLPADAIYQHKLVVFADDTDQLFGELASSSHWLWAARRCSTMRTDPNYNPIHFGTFPRPTATPDVARAACELDAARRACMSERGIGITTLYGRLVLGDEGADMGAVRSAHETLDAAMASAYGWNDLARDMNHGAHPHDRFGVRVWLPDPSVQRELEARLLRLNQERSIPEGSLPAS